MIRLWFKATFWIVTLAMLLALVLGASLRTDAMAQEPTPGQSEVFVTVIYTEQINIRNGPGTVIYDIIGNLQPGESVRALGVSPGRDWVQIEFPGGPGGLGWVHTSLISVSPGNLQIVEPPPTVTPRTTPTIDPTLAAAYIFEPTLTRMPTFTPPPPLEIPQFTQEQVASAKNGLPLGALLFGSGLISVFGFLVYFLRRR